jgi:hypothetical protein
MKRFLKTTLVSPVKLLYGDKAYKTTSLVKLGTKQAHIVEPNESDPTLPYHHVKPTVMLCHKCFSTYSLLHWWSNVITIHCYMQRSRKLHDGGRMWFFSKPDTNVDIYIHARTLTSMVRHIHTTSISTFKGISLNGKSRDCQSHHWCLAINNEHVPLKE